MAYTARTWKDKNADGTVPSGAMPLSAENLNIMEKGIEEAYNRVCIDSFSYSGGQYQVSLGFKPKCIMAASDDGLNSFTIFQNTQNKFAEINDDGFNIAGEVILSNNNISNYFDVNNKEMSYYFAYNSNTDSFISNNKNHNTSARTRLTAKTNMQVSFSYGCDTESADKFVITLDDTLGGSTTILNVGGQYAEKTYSCSLKQGESIVFNYNKDKSIHSGSDQCYFKNLTCVGIPAGDWSYMAIR